MLQNLLRMSVITTCTPDEAEMFSSYKSVRNHLNWHSGEFERTITFNHQDQDYVVDVIFDNRDRDNHVFLLDNAEELSVEQREAVSKGAWCDTEYYWVSELEKIDNEISLVNNPDEEVTEYFDICFDCVPGRNRYAKTVTYKRSEREEAMEELWSEARSKLGLHYREPSVVIERKII